VVTEYHGSGNLSKTIERLPVKFIGGRLCLDLVNTVGGRDPAGAVIRDKIGNYEDLLAWSVLSGTVDRRSAGSLARQAAQDTRAAAQVLARALHLREALYRIFKCILEDRRAPEADADVLRRELSIARAHERLAAQKNGFVWMLAARPEELDRILWAVPLSAAELLTSSDLPRLGQCGGDDCGWMFLDSSRNRRRQWCTMQDCGNRAKVRTFRQKQRGLE
jgi:predicted RNA-binding Zn ribbon-like protein